MKQKHYIIKYLQHLNVMEYIAFFRTVKVLILHLY